MQTLRRIPYWGVVALLVYMPFHVFLSQSLSLVTGGLDEWKLAKDVVIALLSVFTVCLVWRQGRAPRWFNGLVGVTLGYLFLHGVIWFLHPDSYAQSAILGTIYNVRILCCAVVGAGAAILSPEMFTFRSIRRLVLVVSSVVALLAVAQYFLPKDILTHAGYSLDRGVRPNFFIDDNPAFPRVMGTLRDPNSLGAYLLVPVALLTGLLVRLRQLSIRRRWLLSAICLLHAAALYLTFSRSAWLGGVVTVALVVLWQFSSQFVRLARKWWPVGVVALVLLAGGVFWQRHNAVVDGILTHSTAAQVGNLDSNQYHWLYVRRGLDGIRQEPLGHGPGTAGLASIQNPHGGLLTENYYVQVGYEVGVLGLALFIGVTVWLYASIWRRRDDWTAPLLATFWAYVVINMLLHMWSNEAVAAQWWLLAGAAVALPVAAKAKATRRGGRSRATKQRARA